MIISPEKSEIKFNQVNEEEAKIKWEKREWFFIFISLVLLVTLNIVFIFVNWFFWKNDSVTIVTTVTTIFNLIVCLGYWVITMKNKFKKLS